MTNARKASQANPAFGNMGDWQGRHNSAVCNPKPGHEAAVVRMLTGWLEYREIHAQMFESGIGDDYALGPEWKDLGLAIHGLLDGETGRFDCGTLSSAIHDALKSEGFEE